MKLFSMLLLDADELSEFPSLQPIRKASAHVSSGPVLRDASDEDSILIRHELLEAISNLCCIQTIELVNEPHICTRMLTWHHMQCSPLVSATCPLEYLF